MSSRAEQTLREQRPMLTEFLADVGLCREGDRLDLRALLPAFDRWLAAQDLARDEVPYVAARVAAYVSLYFEDHAAASQRIADGRIVISVPFTAGIVREVDAYRLSFEAARQGPVRLRALVDAIAPPPPRGPTPA